MKLSLIASASAVTLFPLCTSATFTQREALSRSTFMQDAGDAGGAAGDLASFARRVMSEVGRGRGGIREPQAASACDAGLPRPPHVPDSRPGGAPGRARRPAAADRRARLGQPRAALGRLAAAGHRRPPGPRGVGRPAAAARRLGRGGQGAAVPARAAVDRHGVRRARACPGCGCPAASATTRSACTRATARRSCRCTRTCSASTRTRCRDDFQREKRKLEGVERYLVQLWRDS